MQNYKRNDQIKLDEKRKTTKSTPNLQNLTKKIFPLCPIARPLLNSNMLSPPKAHLQTNTLKP